MGSGRDVSITELAKEIADVVGYRGRLTFDSSRPDGVPQKLLDVSRLTRFGWRARTPLRTGIERTYRWYLEHEARR